MSKQIAAPQTIIAGRYSYSETTNLLSESSHLKVYKGYDRTTKRDVHVRIIQNGQEDLDGLFKRLLEFKQAKHIFLSQILQLSRPEKDTIILVNEINKSSNLASSLKTTGYLVEEDALYIFKCIMIAIAELHDKACVWGHCYPENVELCTYGIVRLGLNRFHGVNDINLPPQVFLQKEQVTAASDIYLAGLMLYQMLYGCNPFESIPQEDLRDSIKRKKFTLLPCKSPLPIIVSSQTNYLLETLLDYFPGNRPDAKSVLETAALQRITIETELQNYIKPKTNLLSEALQKKYTVFRASKRTISHEYYNQALYLAVSTENDKFMQLVLPELKLYETEPRRIQSYTQKLKATIEEPSKNNDCMVRVEDCEQFKHEMVIILNYYNQGSLDAYLDKKKLKGWIKENEANMIAYLVAMGMKQVSQHGIEALNTLALSRINVHNNRIYLREASIISTSIEKRLKQNYLTIDYYAPEVKQISGFGDISKSDMWSFGVVFYYLLTGSLPLFDQNQQPVLSQLRTSSTNKTTIRKCLQMEPENRLPLQRINIDNYDKSLLEEIFDEAVQARADTEQSLDAMEKKKRQRSLYFTTPKQSIFKNYNRILEESETKCCRIGMKAFLVICLYLMLFFGLFIVNAGNSLLRSGFYKAITLQVPKDQGTRLYNLTILAMNGTEISQKYANSSYEEFKYKLRCFENTYSKTASKGPVFDFVNQGERTALAITGFLFIIVFCVYKCLQLSKFDVPKVLLAYHSGNRDTRWNQVLRWIFSQLFMSMLLFLFFYIYYFEFVVQNGPCLGIQNLGYPRFTSLYLLLIQDSSQYMLRVFMTAGLFSIIILIGIYILCIFDSFTENMMKWRIYIFCMVIWFLVFLICRVGFGSELPLEPTYSYKFSWDLAANYYVFLGMFPELVMLMVWLLEGLFDLVFYMFLLRGISGSAVDEDEESVESVRVKPKTEIKVKIEDEKLNLPSESIDMFKKELDLSIDYY